MLNTLFLQANMTIKRRFMTEVPNYHPVSAPERRRRNTPGQPMGLVLDLGTSAQLDEEVANFADVPTVYTSTIEAEEELAPCTSSKKNPLEV